MNNFKLESMDFLVNVNRGQDPMSVIKRWAVGEYSHVFAYLPLYAGVPQYARKMPSNPRLYVPVRGLLLQHSFLYESSGRGVVIQSLSNRYGQEVVVMRLKSEFRDRIPLIVEEAIKLASDSQSFYDYFCIPLNIVPRVFHDKFGMPIPVKYQRNEQMVCSEACAEPCWRAKVPVLPEDVVPLPGDFVELSGILDEVNRGVLSADWV